MTTYYRTHTIFVKKSHPLFEVVDQYAFLCKNLKNVTTYAFRQTFFDEGRILNVYDLINLFTQTNQIDYRAIPSKVAQQVMIQTKQDFASFKALQQLYQEQLTSKEPIPQCKKISKPNLPKYLDKEKGRANIIFTKQAVRKKEFDKGILSLCPFDSSRPLTFKLGKLAKVITYDDLKEIKIVKTPNGYDVKIVYEVKRPSCSQSSQAEQGKVTKKKKKKKDAGQGTKPSINPKDVERYKQLKIWSVDLGVNNLMTVANNTNERTFIILGRVLKSINQYFNKKLAKLHSKLDKAKDEFVKSVASIHRRISKLYQKRKHKVNDFLHKASRYLINHAVSNNIDLIVVGYNEGWKQEINMGSVNNQKFAYIPFLTLLNMIRYKAEGVGIEVVVTEESYTSRCSFLDSEELKHHDVYKGNRIHRGLFKSANNMIINADVNGAFNIMRKVIGNFDYDPIQARSTPKTINVLKQKSIVV